MFKNKKNKILDATKVSETLKSFNEKPVTEKTSIRDLLEQFHENGIVLAMIFFSLPIAIPLPYPPGFVTIIGTPLIILAIQMLLGYKRVKLPEKIIKYEIANTTLIMLGNKIVPLLGKVEKYIKPRYNFATSVYCEQCVGVISLICAISIAIPLPLTNSLPALGICVMGLGLLNRDGLVILLGIGISFIGVSVAAGAIIASWAGIKYLFNIIF